MIEIAHAKINLTLNITHRRKDGFHELESIFLPLELNDQLDIQIAEETKIICNDHSIPTDASNLIWKAIDLIKKTYQRYECFHVQLKKNIPAMAGLGGGSSDAAAMLRAANQLLDLRLSSQELIQLAKQIGADVPFFIAQQPCSVRGIGEKLELIEFPFCPYILLVKPEQGVSTKEAYMSLDLQQCDHPPMHSIMAAIKNVDYTLLVSLIGNSLEESALRLLPEISQIKNILMTDGFDVALMSGSGSTVFAFTHDQTLLDKTAKYFQQKHYSVWKTMIK